MGKIFPDQAMTLAAIDRLVHHATILEMNVESYRKRFEEFSLSLHPDKTRLIEFGRFAAVERRRRGLAKPETFNFLGFTHICGRHRRGAFLLIRMTRHDRKRARPKKIKEELRRRNGRAAGTEEWLRRGRTKE